MHSRLPLFFHKNWQTYCILRKNRIFAKKNNTMEAVILGTEVKFAVYVVADGFSMDDDDFSLMIMKGRTVVKEIEKSELVIEDGTYLMCLDTEEIGAGTFDLAVRAYVPDGHFPDGLRTEIERVSFINVRKL